MPSIQVWVGVVSGVGGVGYWVERLFYVNSTY